MRRAFLALSAALFLAACGGGERSASDAAGDEAQIKAVIADLVAAWTTADDDLWADQFTDDAEFVVWNGYHMTGRDAIRDGHREIWSTVYEGTKLRLEATTVKFLGDDVAVVIADGDVAAADAAFPAQPGVRPMVVFERDGDSWKIAAFHNLRLPDSPNIRSGSEPAKEMNNG